MSHLQQPLLYPPHQQAPHHPHPVILAAPQLDDSKPRAPRDVLFARLYLALIVAWAALWALSALTQDKAYGVLLDADAFLNDPTHCPAPKAAAGGPLADMLPALTRAQQEQLLASSPLVGAAGGTADMAGLLRISGVLLALSLLLALASSCVFVLLLQHVPGVLVLLTVVVQVALPAAWGVAALYAGYQAAAMWAFGLAGVVAVGCLMSWEKLKLVTSLLGLSARALRDQPGLLVLSVGLNLLLPVLWGTLGWAAVIVAASGNVLPNPSRATFVDGHCISTSHKVVSCCVWQPAPWSAWFPALSSALLVWTMLVLSQVKVFVAAGAVSLWYYSAPATPVLGGRPGPTSGTVRGATWRSLGHALGPSLGTLCVGGVILMLTSWVRYLLARWRKAREGRGLMAALMACTMGCLLELLEQLTKFSVVRAAMTGQGFWQASHEVVSLLRRNTMDAYNVWWYPPLVLNLASSSLAATLSFISYKTTLVLWGGSTPGSIAQVDASAAALTLAALTGLGSLFMMGFVSGMVLHVLDAMWVCLAVDREQGCCTQPLVHQVLLALPTAPPGVVVQQPAGDLAYAAPLAMPLPTTLGAGPYYTPSPLGHSPQDYWSQHLQQPYPMAAPYAPQVPPGVAPQQWQPPGRPDAGLGGDPRYPHIQPSG